MNLSNPFRNELSSVPFLNDALDLVLGKINAIWNSQHKADGSHGAVTADTLTIGSDPADGSWLGNVSGSLVPTSATQDLGATIITHGSIARDRPWRGLHLSGDISWGSFSDGSVILSPVLTRSGGSLTLDTNTTGTLTFKSRNGVNSTTFAVDGFLGVTSDKSVAVTGDVNASTGYLERSRSTRVGVWIAFTPTRAAATGTWTGGTVATCSYMLVGLTMVINFYIIGSSNSAVTANVSFTVPGGFTCTDSTLCYVLVTDGGGEVIGKCIVGAAGTSVTFQKINGVTIGINAATLEIRGQVILNIG